MSYLGWNSGCGGDLITLPAVEVAHCYQTLERERWGGEMRGKRYDGMHGLYYLLVYSIFKHSEPNLRSESFGTSSSFLCSPRVLFRSPARPRSQTQRWTSGLFTGKISGSEHQIRGFLGHIRRGDALPVRTLHKGAGPDGITRGKDVS